MPDFYINETFADILTRNPHIREFVFYGGSGSGKSTSVAQYLLWLFFQKHKTPIRMLFSRKWYSALRNTLLVDCVDILNDWGAYEFVNHNKTTETMTFAGNRIDFMGMDNPEKVKGANYTYIWLEETTDFDLADVRQLRLRLGRNIKNKDAKYIFTFNPIDAMHWTWTDLVCTEKANRLVYLSTYKDNYANLSPEWIEDLLRLKDEDPNYYQIYAEGKPGVLQNIIYTNYTIKNFDVAAEVPDCLGLDFGFNNPSSLVALRQTADGFKAWELLYKPYLTNADLKAWLIANQDTFFFRDKTIYCDAAEPARIEELRNAGFTAVAADKSVKDGIDYVKSQRMELCAGSANLTREIRTYKYREDKNGIVYDEPVKFNDHALDAVRYAAYSHWGKHADVKIPKQWIGFGGMTRYNEDDEYEV